MAAGTISVKLDEALRERLKRLSEARSRSPHYLMGEAIREYVEREERREQFKRDALAAWQEYRDTGLHATAEEVGAWLETWGTDQEAEPPSCHG
jgi:predicted transcriptional regulator